MKIRLQEILDHQNKTIYSLSKEIGVAQNNLSKIIKGETTSIKYDILENLCIALKITPNDIFQIDYPYSIEQEHNILSPYSEDEIVKMIEYQEQKAKEDEENYQYYIENKEELDKFFGESQKRFDFELELDKLVSDFIDKILEGLFISLKFEPSVTKVFEKYKGYDIFTTNLKVEKFYTYFYRFLNHYSNKDNERFIRFLNDIQHIYKNGGLDKLSDEQLEELKGTIEFLNNETNQKD